MAGSLRVSGPLRRGRRREKPTPPGDERDSDEHYATRRRTRSDKHHTTRRRTRSDKHHTTRRRTRSDKHHTTNRRTRSDKHHTTNRRTRSDKHHTTNRRTRSDKHHTTNRRTRSDKHHTTNRRTRSDKHHTGASTSKAKINTTHLGGSGSAGNPQVRGTFEALRTPPPLNIPTGLLATARIPPCVSWCVEQFRLIPRGPVCSRPRGP